MSGVCSWTLQQHEHIFLAIRVLDIPFPIPVQQVSTDKSQLFAAGILPIESVVSLHSLGHNAVQTVCNLHAAHSVDIGPVYGRALVAAKQGLVDVGDDLLRPDATSTGFPSTVSDCRTI